MQGNVVRHKRGGTDLLSPKRMIQELAVAHSGGINGRLQGFNRLVLFIITQAEGAEMHGTAGAGLQNEMRPERILRRKVMGRHEPHRLKRADGKQGQAQVREALRYLFKVRPEAGIAREIDSPRRTLNNKSTPQRFVVIAHPAVGEMFCRNKVDGKRRRLVFSCCHQSISSTLSIPSFAKKARLPMPV